MSTSRDELLALARECAGELVNICEAAQRSAHRTGNTFALDRHRVATMIAGRFSARLAATPKAGVEREGGRAVIEDGAVVIRFPLDAMQVALDGAWGMRIFDKRQKITDIKEFAEEFRNELNSESENGTTLIHRMADKAFLEMMEQGAFGFEPHEDQEL